MIDGAIADPSFAGMLPMFVLFAVLLYALILRPQKKRMQSHKARLDALKVGDEIATIGGLMGKVMTIEDTRITLSLGKNNAIDVQPRAVAEILSAKQKD